MLRRNQSFLLGPSEVIVRGPGFSTVGGTIVNAPPTSRKRMFGLVSVIPRKAPSLEANGVAEIGANTLRLSLSRTVVPSTAIAEIVGAGYSPARS